MNKVIDMIQYAKDNKYTQHRRDMVNKFHSTTCSEVMEMHLNNMILTYGKEALKGVIKDMGLSRATRKKVA